MTGEQADPGTVEVVVGVVGRPHGVRGDVSIDLRTDEPERRFAEGTTLRVDGDFPSGVRRLTVASTRWHQDRFLVKFAECPDRTAVEKVRGAVLLADVPADETPSDEGEYYDRQLIGLAAHTTAGEVVGTVTSVIHLPSQDLLAIATDAGERLVPFVADLVPEVDLGAGRIVVNDVPGLLDDAAEDAR